MASHQRILSNHLVSDIQILSQKKYEGGIWGYGNRIENKMEKIEAESNAKILLSQIES